MPCHCSPLFPARRVFEAPLGSSGSWQSFTFGRAGLEKNLDSTGAWGQHAEGPAWSRAGQGLQEAVDHMGTEACPSPYSSSSLSPPPWGGEVLSLKAVPTIWLSGKGLGAELALHHGLGRIWLIEGSWPLWTTVRPQSPG